MGIVLSISNGNTKLGKIPNLNLPPGVSCIKDAPCLKECYAMKAWRQYKNVRNSWQRNLDLWTTDPVEFESQIDSWFSYKKRKPARFRWHSAGDIPSQEYFDMMVRVAKRNPGTLFLAFTKRYCLNLEHDAENLSVIFSRWPGLEFPAALSDKPQAHFVNGDQTTLEITDDVPDCPGCCVHCSSCWRGKSVTFHKH